MCEHLLTDDNCVKVCVGSVCTYALVDTGADKCCMSESYFDRIRETGCDISVYPTNMSVVFAGGRSEKVVCDAQTSINIEGRNYIARFHVIPGLQKDVYLGRDFLKDYGMNLYYHSRSNEHQREYVVRTVQGIRIPAYTEILQSEALDKKRQIVQGTCMNFSGTRFAKHPEVWVARSCVRVDKGTIPVRLANLSDHEVYLRPGTVLGFARVVVEEKEEKDTLFEISTPVPVTRGKKGKKPVFQPVVDYSHSNLSENQRQQMDTVLKEHCNAFVGPDGKLGETNWVEHEIALEPGSKPVQQMPFRLSPSMRENLQKAVQEQVDLDIVEPTYDGGWASPAFLVGKASGGYRLVCDYRKLNAVTEPQYLAIPRIDDALDAVGQIQPNFISALDLMMAFHQIPIREEDRDKTAFLTPFGKFRYKRLSMGLKNAARSCQMVVDLVLQGLQFHNCICYIDDILVFSRTFEGHLKDIAQVLSRVENAGLKLKPAKCIIAAAEVPFLGHVLSKNGIKPNPKKVEAIRVIKPPKSQTQMRRFLGMSGFYRKFIPNYATRARCLYAMTKKNKSWKWGEEEQAAFEDLKNALTSDSLLLYPDFSKSFVVTTDASDIGLGATLSQEDSEGNLRPVAYAAKLFNSAQRNYSTLDRELAGIVYACLHWRVYLEGRAFLIRTDHAPLKYILNPRSKLTPRQVRWAADLREFDFHVEHVKGKDNIVPDALSRLEGKPYEKDDLEDTLVAFPALLEVKLESVHTATPSKTRRIPKRDRRKLRHSITKRLTFAPEPTVVYVDELDKIAEKVVTAEQMPESLMAIRAQPNNVKRRRYQTKVKVQDKEMFPCLGINREEMREAQEQDSFCKGILDFIRFKVLPEEDVTARLIILRESHYIVSEDILYFIHTNVGPKAEPLAQIVIPLEYQKLVLQAHHDSPMGGHLGANKMLNAMKQRYYWPQLSTDVLDYCASCEMCAATKRMTHPIKPPLMLRDPSPRPFDTVNLDALERLPTTDRGMQHIIVVVDYYSRYVIAFAVPDLTAATFARHFYDKVICRFGSVRRIVMDNGKAFASKHFEKFCAAFGITQSFTSVAHPMTSGLVERTNRSILGVLRNYISESQTDWDVHLDAICFSLNASQAYSTGHTPHMLLYGCNPVWPTENHLKLDLGNAQTVSDHFVKIIQTQELANKHATQHLKKVQEQMKERYDKNAYDPNIKEGDICFLYWPRIKDPKTKLKLARVFHGPYVVVRYHSTTTVFLRHARTGHFLDRPVNIMRLKKGLDRKEVEKRWQPPEVEVEDPEQLDEGDLPLDSFEGVSAPFSDVSENVADELANPPVSIDQEEEREMESSEQPKAAKTISLNGETAFHDIINVMDVCRPRGGEVKYLVHFQDGDRLWITIDHLNTTAQQKYITSELKDRIKDVPVLRNR